VEKVLQQFDQLSRSNRLGDVVIHPRGQAALAVALHGMGGHSDNRQALACVSFSDPDGGGRLESVHFRHLYVHQHHIKVFFIEGGQGFAPVSRYRDMVSLFLQNAAGYFWLTALSSARRTRNLAAFGLV
jgi:hypothetical protein